MRAIVAPRAPGGEEACPPICKKLCWNQAVCLSAVRVSSYRRTRSRAASSSSPAMVASHSFISSTFASFQFERSATSALSSAPPRQAAKLASSSSSAPRSSNERESSVRTSWSTPGAKHGTYLGASTVAAGQAPVQAQKFAQQLRLPHARIRGDLPAVVRGARRAVRAGLEVLAQARLDRRAVAERAAVVDELGVLPKREPAGTARRAPDHGRVERVAWAGDRHLRQRKFKAATDRCVCAT